MTRPAPNFGANGNPRHNYPGDPGVTTVVLHWDTDSFCRVRTMLARVSIHTAAHDWRQILRPASGGIGNRPSLVLREKASTNGQPDDQGGKSHDSYGRERKRQRWEIL